MGYDERAPGKGVITPESKRAGTEEQSEVLTQDFAEKYRSAEGSLIYYSGVVEIISYAIIELARDLRAPAVEDWHDLTRVARYLFEKQGYAVEILI